jgi:hypothetical protein
MKAIVNIKNKIMSEIKQEPKSDNAILISYLTLRRAIGFIGIFLPIVLIVGSFITNNQTELLPSISDYYYSSMGDFFVGALCAVALFLYFYQGYSYKDNIAGNIAAFFALFVAFFPTYTDIVPIPPHFGIMTNLEVAGKIHYLCAALFFLMLTYFSLFLFVLKGESISNEKKKRNRVYRTCGYVMLSCIILMAINFSIDSVTEFLEPYKPVLVLETIALWAFGISWITKSNVIFRDIDTSKAILVNLPENVKKTGLIEPPSN